MFTHKYKGAYIHGYTDKPECKVQIVMGDGDDLFHTYKSYRAAQIAITKFIKKYGWV